MSNVCKSLSLGAIRSRSSPRATAVSDLPFKPPLRITSRAKPSRGMTRDSMPAAPVTGSQQSRVEALPGYYMMFLISDQDVPSLAKWGKLQ